jgi:hypothetical protein
MDLNHFDSALKNALDNYQAPYDPSTWAALESKLDAMPAPDAVDKALKPVLERAELRYEASTWAALSQKMDGRARAKRVRMTKLAEAAILLLLLLNLEGVLGVCHKFKPALLPKPAAAPIAGQSPSKKNFYKKSNNSHPAGTVPGTAPALSVTANLLDAGLATQPEILANALPGAQTTGSLLDAEPFYQQNGPVHFSTETLPAGQASKQVLYAQALPFIGSKAFERAKKTNNKRIYAATFGTFDQNYVRENAHSDRNGQMGAGMAIGWRKGGWGVETGLTYAKKKYRPERKNIEYDNDPLRGISFFYTDAVEADAVSVPLKVTRRVAKAGQFSAHAVAGATAHYAINKEHSYSTVTYPPVNPIPGPNPGPGPNTSFPDGKGLMEGGGLAHNAYATADLGLRLEHNLGKRFTAFIEPVYRQNLGGGFGPRSAQISTFSVQAGVMASL